MTPFLPLLFALARPVEVLEEWELVPASSLAESVTARGLYRRADGPHALLPEAVQGAERPEVFSPGVPTNLAVRKGPQGWEVDLPSGGGETVRVVARVSRPLAGVRLFRLDWPAALPPPATPTRRVAMAPRDWILRAPPAWNCPDDFSEVATCVSTGAGAVPAPLTLRLPPPRAPRNTLVGAALALLAALAAGSALGPRERARERLAGALGGAFVGACVALALVGARAAGWAPALLEAAVPAALLGTLAVRNEPARVTGAAALFVVPLLVVLDGRLGHVLTAVAVIVMALGASLFRPASPLSDAADESEGHADAGAGDAGGSTEASAGGRAGGADGERAAAAAEPVSPGSPSGSSPPPPPASGP